MIDRRRGPGARLLLTLVALATLIAGYYLGQYWQRRPLADLSAVVYPAGLSVHYPAALALDATADGGRPWRLFAAIDTGVEDCRALLRHFARVFNRLAGRPEVQARLRLTLLAFDRPDEQAIGDFLGGVEWAEVVSSGDRRALAGFSAQLGIAPAGTDWCGEYQRDSVLVAPDRRRWALIPYAETTDMAHNLITIVDFVE